MIWPGDVLVFKFRYGKDTEVCKAIKCDYRIWVDIYYNDIKYLLPNSVPGYVPEEFIKKKLL